ncbi:hypothetical protein Goklo_000421, partial [Gossypium klotzschianum]|nr:hypothetical protein [Gossypium klotzschianum]
MWSVLGGELAIVALAPSVVMKLRISYMCFAIAQQQRKFGRLLVGRWTTWSCLFRLVAWRIWKNRNIFVFQNISWPPTEIIKISFGWAQQYGISHMRFQQNDHISDPSASLMDSRVHLFTDGAVARDSEKASVGGVLRDQFGNWILEFNRFLGSYTRFEAKLWGILDGMLLLLSKGFKR